MEITAKELINIIKRRYVDRGGNFGGKLNQIGILETLVKNIVKANSEEEFVIALKKMYAHFNSLFRAQGKIPMLYTNAANRDFARDGYYFINDDKVMLLTQDFTNCILTEIISNDYRIAGINRGRFITIFKNNRDLSGEVLRSNSIIDVMNFIARISNDAITGVIYSGLFVELINPNILDKIRIEYGQNRTKKQKTDNILGTGASISGYFMLAELPALLKKVAEHNANLGKIRRAGQALRRISLRRTIQSDNGAYNGVIPVLSSNFKTIDSFYDKLVNSQIKLRACDENSERYRELTTSQKVLELKSKSRVICQLRIDDLLTQTENLMREKGRNLSTLEIFEDVIYRAVSDNSNDREKKYLKKDLSIRGLMM